MHTDFACLLYGMLNNKLDPDRIREIVMEAVEIEKEFVTDALPVELIGMNSRLMCQYVEFVTDRLLGEIGHPRIFGSANPVPFMEHISLQNKTNFFEARVGAYQKAGVMNKSSDDRSFALDEEF